MKTTRRTFLGATAAILAYRCTEKADRLEDMIRGELDGKEAA